jgi:hypothetical protein
MSWIPRLAGLCLCVSLTSGCIYSRHQTNTARSATEQLLLTQSIERAVARLELPEVDDRDLAVETVSLAPDEARYIQAEVEARLRQAGAHVVSPAEAEIIVVVLVSASGTAARELFFGVPPIPLPNGATLGIPLLRVLKQRGYTRLRLVARDSTGAHVLESPPVMERGSFDIYAFLFLALRRNTIYPGEGFDIAID